METKKCSKCGIEKTISEFCRNKRETAGIRDCCSGCNIPDGSKPHIWEPHSASVGGDKFLWARAFVNKKRYFCKKNNIPFMLTPHYLEDLLSEFCVSNYVVSEPRHPFSPSVDRIDPQLGYVEGNIRICWFIENLCKNKWDEETVIEFCKRKLGIY